MSIVVAHRLRVTEALHKWEIGTEAACPDFPLAIFANYKIYNQQHFQLIGLL